MMQSIRSCVLPLAMLTGGVFYGFFSRFSTAIPYFIFTMLLLTFCKLAPKDVKFKKLHLWLILIQILGSIAVYLIVSLFDTVTAQGAFICVLAPTAMAAAVITGMLGGNVAFLTSYVLVSNRNCAGSAGDILIYGTEHRNAVYRLLYIYMSRSHAAADPATARSMDDKSRRTAIAQGSFENKSGDILPVGFFAYDSHGTHRKIPVRTAESGLHH